MNHSIHRDALSAPEPDSPGRACPACYGYAPVDLSHLSPRATETLYVVGGLYGNTTALEAIEGEFLARERGTVCCVFNGDFHWFDTARERFDRITDGVMRHHAIVGNVEMEFLGEGDDAGCGCAYPAEVEDAIVERSNRIHRRLKSTALANAGHLDWLRTLPMQTVALVGDARVGIVHGDAWSLAGWKFAVDRMDAHGVGPTPESAFVESGVDIYASTHTCLPAMRLLEVDGRVCVVANNGAAGLPNFRGSTHGVVTRISVLPSPIEALYGTTLGAGSSMVHVDAVAVHFDQDRWCREFLSQWPPGSPAHESYWDRIRRGPGFTLAEAGPRAFGSFSRIPDRTSP